MAKIIKKFSKIKKLGIFKDFSWRADLPELKRYNIVYGWNGTGKTTLSKLIDSLNAGASAEFPDFEYTVADSDSATVSNGAQFITPIRVFNQDYINRHIDFDQQSSDVIHYTLTEDEDLLKAIKDDEVEKVRLEAEIQTRQKEQRTAEDSRGKTFTEIAKTIGQGTQGAIVRNYNKTNAETAFGKLGKKQVLNDIELDKLSKSVSQNSMEKVSLVATADIVENIENVVLKANKLLETTVESVVIERLKENADISEWVESGIAIHKEHASQKCEFCGNDLPENRMEQLASYFNDADTKLKKDIDDLLSSLRDFYGNVQSLKPTDKMSLYVEYRDEYESAITVMSTAQDVLLKDVEALGNTIKDKKLHTTEKVEKIVNAPDATAIIDAIVDANAILKKHNDKTDSFEKSRSADSQKIETHFLSTIYDDIKEHDRLIDEAKTKLTELKDGKDGDPENIGLARLTKRISENKAKISSSKKACSELNQNLKKFLGHSEISFDTNDDDTGYTIKRGEQLAKNLSEGEKTAVAFIFFVVQLKDENFDAANGIIVIDDPISSLDSNSQFQAFSFMKTATGDAAQLIVLTHNFDFLKLSMNWIKNSRSPYALLMVKNIHSIDDGSRKAYIDKLDPALEKFESEYHYLFNLIYNYKDDGTIENAYNMPNIARKLLDTFLMFCVPIKDNTYNRLQKIDFDDEKKSAIYKFVNDQSHITGAGFDPALVPEAQKNVVNLLEMMEFVAKSHYDYLIESMD